MVPKHLVHCSNIFQNKGKKQQQKHKADKIREGKGRKQTESYNTIEGNCAWRAYCTGDKGGTQWKEIGGRGGGRKNNLNKTGMAYAHKTQTYNKHITSTKIYYWNIYKRINRSMLIKIYSNI